MKKINFKIYLEKSKQRISVFGITPRFDWIVILIIASVLLICGTVFATFLYIKVNDGSLFEGVEDTASQIEIETKQKRIQAKVDLINQRSFDEMGQN